MKYFESFPSLAYTFDPEVKNIFFVKDIFTRIRMLDSIINNISVYYDYEMKESDTIESIAYKYYGDVNRFWIILFTNTIIDPQFDIPLKYQAFVEYMNKKYEDLDNHPDTSGIVVSQSILDHYEKRVTKTLTASNNYSTTNTTTTYYSNTIYSIDGVNFNSLPNIANPVITRPSPPDVVIDGITISTDVKIVAVSAFDKEVLDNDKKRTLKLVKKDFIFQIEKEFKKLLGNVV